MLKLFALVFFNLLLIGLLLYLLEVYNFTNIYSSLRQRIFKPENSIAIPYNVEELKLLEAEEHKKIMDAFRLRELELAEKERNYQTKSKELTAQKQQLADEKNSLNEKKKQWLKKKERETAYNKQVKKLAATFLNMPPESAAKRLIAIKDDVLIIDVIKEIEILCEQEEKISIVPYLYSLMPEKDAARLLKKSTIEP